MLVAFADRLRYYILDKNKCQQFFLHFLKLFLWIPFKKSFFKIDTLHYNYRQIHFFFKNGMFFKYFSVLLHANCIGKIGFDNKMV